MRRSGFFCKALFEERAAQQNSANGFCRFPIIIASRLVSVVSPRPRRAELNQLPKETRSNENTRKPQFYLGVASGVSAVLAAWFTWKVLRRNDTPVASGQPSNMDLASDARLLHRPPHASSVTADDLGVNATGSLPKLNKRERHFLHFASVEYNGQIFMTPRDFLDSLTQDRPRNRLSRRVLTESEVRNQLRSTPPFRRNSSQFFRDQDENGIISFAEYVFLLSVLTKPQSGFRIAFNMFDMDGNEVVDKQEFLVIQALVSTYRASGVSTTHHPEHNRSYLESLMSQSRLADKLERKRIEAALTGKTLAVEVDPSAKDVDSWTRSRQLVDKMDTQDTTLSVHLFGISGNGKLSFDDFRKFHENLQEELLHVEFQEFARGRSFITEVDFARLLLRYTVTHQDDYLAYIRRVQKNLKHERGITYAQFRDFCLFLNDLETFVIAVKLYAMANLKVSPAEFARAVKIATGFELDSQVVETVFKIFDVNDDNQLSYSEFTAVMKDRVHRGFKSHFTKPSTSSWDEFKKCVHNEVKLY